MVIPLEILVLSSEMRCMSRIYYFLPLLLLVSALWPHSCHAEISNPVLTSTSYKITLSFEPNPAATNYTVSFRVAYSPFLNDIALDPPYNVSRLNVSYYDVSPGINYTVTLYENKTKTEYEVFTQDISTVPLAPINVNIEDQGTTFLNVTWSSYKNITYSSHRIYFRPPNDTTWQMANGTANESYILKGLVPGYLYEVYVTAIASDAIEAKESSPSETLSSPTLPAPPTNLAAEAENTTHIMVTWIPQPSSYQDSYLVKYLAHGTSHTASCQVSPCSFAPGPPAGQEVTIFVSSVSHGAASTAMEIKSSTEPNPVKELEAEEGIRSLIISWKAPANADLTSYHIRVVRIRNNKTDEYTMPASKNDTLVTFDVPSLFGGSAYQVFVTAETAYARGEPENNVFRTVPEPVSDLNVEAINSTAFQLSWAYPLFTVFDKIVITVEKPDKSLKIEVGKDVTKREVTGLIPGETYQISVIVHTPVSPLVSRASYLTITTEPIKPRVVSSVSGERDITVTLAREEDVGVFSSFIAYLKPQFQKTASSEKVIVFDSLTPGMSYTMSMMTMSGLTKSEVVSVDLYTKPRPPQLLNVEVLNNNSIRVSWDAPDVGGYDNFAVTVQESDGGSSQQEKTTSQFDVVFSSITAGTTYNVSIVTVKGDQVSRAMKDQNTTEQSSSSSGGVVGGVIGALAGIGVVVVIVFFVIKRKRRPKKATKHTGSRTNWEQSTMNKFSRPVKLVHFPDHVRKMAADSDFKYAEEYEDLKEVGRDQATLAAEFPPNRPKNRFTNILPYDHSRVKLLPTDDEEGSDYINANYMPGYNSKREYIATQGPLPATRDDFWRMLWEQCTRNIVMLTRCQEKGREKSDHYWPSDSEPKFYGDLQVVILNETHMPDWTIIEFKVSHGDQSRQVRHFHYRSWPDFGVPKDPTSLIRFVRSVREKLIREGGPIIAHCSAGVGRSGTFIVLDNLLQLIREKDEVDVFSIVYSLRKERVLMVQTEQQYKFIHECLLCVLENREDDTTYANLGQINVGFEDDEGINLEGP